MGYQAKILRAGSLGLKAWVMAGASVAALGAAAVPGVAAAQAAVSNNSATLGEVVVTARRKAESLQDVPQSVLPITSEALQNLQIKNAIEIQYLAPGLRLTPNETGAGASFQLRGTTFDNRTGTPPTIGFYLNDVPAQPNHFVAGTPLYDIGQIEVLRGPQGTTRGVSAPSGAITFTTRKPNLGEYGGYVDGTATDLLQRNLNGALNVPIVRDVFGVRLAGSFEQNQQNYTRGVYAGSQRPRSRATAGRISTKLAPSELFDLDVMYEHREWKQRIFDLVAGPGRPTPGLTFSPALDPEDRGSLETLGYQTMTMTNLLTAHLASHFAGHTLEYTGGYFHQRIDQFGPGDIGGVLPGAAAPFATNFRFRQTGQEIRLSSDKAPGKMFDYTVGAFYLHIDRYGFNIPSRTFLSGAFGAPGAAPTAATIANPNPRYVLTTFVGVPQFFQEVSVFASGTAHLGSKTDITAGIRKMSSNATTRGTLISRGETGQTFNAVAGLPAATCAAIRGVPSPVYAGACDVPVGPVITASGNPKIGTKENPTTYNVQLSHRFSRDLMVYASTGTAYRPPSSALGVQGTFVSSANPQLSGLVNHPSEKSKNYEVGFKSDFLDRRARLNVSVYQQKFKNYQSYQTGIRFFNATTNALGLANFIPSVNVKVRGIDVESAFKISPQWDVSADFSYSDETLGSPVPCNIVGANGQPFFNTVDPSIPSRATSPNGPGIISFCDTGHASLDPPWNVSIKSNFEQPITGEIDGFVRGLVNYTPKNKKVSNFTADAYAIVNLFAGVRSHDGAWEASLFVRNLFNKFEVLTAEPDLPVNGVGAYPTLAVPVGYHRIRSTAPREFGANIRYAFGSR